jgi:hypothetical protein
MKKKRGGPEMDSQPFVGQLLDKMADTTVLLAGCGSLMGGFRASLFTFCSCSFLSPVFYYYVPAVSFFF